MKANAWFYAPNCWSAACLFAYPDTPNNVKALERQVDHDGISLLASMPEESVVGSAIKLKMTVQNLGKKDASWSLRGAYWDYDLTLVDSKNRSVPMTRFGKGFYGDYRGLGGAAFEMTLSPGKQVQATLNLARVFDLSVQGDYALIVSLQGRLKIEKMRFRVIEEGR